MANLSQKNRETRDIAIIGIACRFPGAKDYEQFWNNLANGVQSIGEIPPERWSTAEYYSAQVEERNKSVSKWCGILENADQFDHRFFNISPREAKIMDPQQRILLEETWHCIEDSGVPLKHLQQKKTSVFVGVMSVDYGYQTAHESAGVDSMSCLGNFEAILSNRLSYAFDFQGASMTINAACASSLVAMNEAKRSLVLGESDFAIAGGVNLSLHPRKYISFSKSRMLSPDGRCKTFDMDANGYVPGDGVGLLLLQRLDQAIKEGNRIYGVIKGAGVNHGGKALSITAPRVEAQRNVIVAAYRDAGISPETVTYHEAHGTGTSLGDPIEVEAATQAFQEHTGEVQFCSIGSVKTNIGHLESAAGVAGVIKVLMMMRYRKIPPACNIQTLNPMIDFTRSPFKVVTKLTDWEGVRADLPLRAGVSSFGFGGVNAHVIVEEYRQTEEADPNQTDTEETPAQLFTLSAKTRTSLEQQIAQWRHFIDSDLFQRASLGDICKTLQTGRESFAFRCGVRVKKKEDVLEFLHQESPIHSAIIRPEWSLACGEQMWSGYTEVEELLHQQPFVHDQIEQVFKCLDTIDAGQKWRRGFARKKWAVSSRPLYSFIVNYAMVKTWCDLGLDVKMAAGVGSGVWVSLAISGMLEITEILSLFMETRAWSKVQLSRPKMAFYDPVHERILLPHYFREEYVRSLIDGAVTIEVEDEPRTSSSENLLGASFSENRDMVPRSVAYFVEKARLLYTSQFTFQKLMQDWSREVKQQTGENLIEMLYDERLFLSSRHDYDRKKLLLLVPIIASLKTVNEKWKLTHRQDGLSSEFCELIDLLVDEVMTKQTFIQLVTVHDPDYQMAAVLLHERQHLMDPNKPYHLIKEGNQMIEDIADFSGWIEKALGTRAITSALPGELVVYGECVAESEGKKISVQRSDDGLAGLFMENLLQLWLLGADLKWEKLYPAGSFQRASLPVYRFDRTSFWLERTLPAPESVNPNQDDNGKERLYHTYRWKQANLPAVRHERLAGPLLLFTLDANLGYAFRDRYSGRQVIFVRPGNSFAQTEENGFELNPVDQSDYQKLLIHLRDRNQLPATIVHMWSEQAFSTNPKQLDQQLKNGIYSLGKLAKAMMEHDGVEWPELLYVFSRTDAAIQPVYAAMSGFCKTLVWENPKFSCKCVEISDLPETSFLVEMIGNELSEHKWGMQEIRYSGGTRWRKTIESVDLENQLSHAADFRSDGVYLITGGVGGLGWIFARHLASKTKGTLILSGRSPLTEQTKAKLKELEALGARAVYMQADVSKKVDVERLITEITERYQELHGIVHSAGVYRSGLILTKKDEAAEAVLGPKVYGTVFLDECTSCQPLDFFIMFSSVAGVVGDVGLSDYAYANRFLDEFADWREQQREQQKRSGRTLSISWPLWKDGGIQIADTISQRFLEQTGLSLLPTEQGIAFFDALALGSSLTHCLVSYGDKAKIEKFLGDRDAVHAEPGEQPACIDGAVLYEKTAEFLKRSVADEINLPVEEIDSEASFEEFGIDSIIIHHLNAKIEKELGPASKTLFFEFKNLQQLTDYFVKHHAVELTNYFGLRPEDNALTAVEEGQMWTRFPPPSFDGPQISSRVKNDVAEEEIAIVGVSGIYPQARNLREFWKNLHEGKDCIVEIPSERWDYREYYDSAPERAREGKIYGKWGGFLQGADEFDPLFFRISPREAEMMDPQERLFLKTVWATLEDAGYTPEQLRQDRDSGRKTKIGVFVGVTTNSYQLIGVTEWSKGNSEVTHALPWSIANRVSYAFDFHGPSLTLDTACSSSLTAIHLACESLRRGESSVAIAGGVNLLLHPAEYAFRCQMRMLSPAGRCHSFGERGDGYVPGEGVGAILLKPLSAAIADNDHIHAVIKGSSINHGGRTNGYTVPNPNAQADVIAEALQRANVNPRTISYVEAHGTGTALGDPIEISGLTKAFREHTQARSFCSIGSVKSNIGHLEGAAGISGLTKILLQLKHKTLVPSLHAELLNPNISFEETPFYVQRSEAEWKRPVIEEDGQSAIYPRRACISSFGAGGSNAHIILEEYVSPVRDQPIGDGRVLILLSARTEESLKAYAEDLDHFLQEECEQAALSVPKLEDIAYTLQIGREPMDERLAMVVGNETELRDKLRQYYLYGKVSSRVYRGNKSSDNGKLALLVNGKAGAEFVRLVIAESDLDKMAQMWAMGIDFEWSILYPGKKPKRIPIPTYPFAKERYWFSGKNAGKHGVLLPAAKLHPLLGSNVSTIHEQKFRTVLAKEEYMLADHVIEHANIFPGVGYIEMARVAGELAGEQKARSIKDIVWTNPIAVGEYPQHVEISLRPKGDTLEYRVSTGNSDQRVLHGQGTVIFGPPPERTVRVDLADVQKRCTTIISGQECYKRLADIGYFYGPAFQAIQELRASATEVLAILKLPDVCEADWQAYTLHPSLLDGALQSFIGLTHEKQFASGKRYLPFSIGEVEILRTPLTRNCYAYVTRADEEQAAREKLLKFNVQIVSEAGDVLVNIRDFSLYERNQPREKRTELLKLFLQLQRGELDIPQVEQIAEGV